MKTIKNALCLLLSLVMLLSMLISCKKKGDAEETESVETTVETEDIYNVADDVGNHNFDRICNILHWQAYTTEFCTDIEKANNGSVVQLAMVERQMTIEERLGISIEFIAGSSHYGGISAFNKQLETSFLASAGDYDIASHYSCGAAPHALRGYSTNILELDYVDLDKIYWVEDIKNYNIINNQLYFVTGYLTNTFFAGTSCVLYNQQMLDENGLENPVELVDNDQWTFEKMKSMALGMYSDINSNQKVDRGDSFGIIINQGAAPVDALATAVGIKTTKLNDEGKLSFDNNFLGMVSENKISYLNKLMTQNDAVFMDIDATGEDMNTIFPAGRSLFLIGEMASYGAKLRASDISGKVGIVPLPKFDENQDRYYSDLNPQHSVYTVPGDAKNLEMCGAVLELLAAEGYRTLMPAVYENRYKLQYSKDADMARMIELCYSSLMLEPAKTWGDAIGLYSVARDAIKGNKSWSVTVASNSRTIWQSRIDDINEFMFSR